MFDKIENAQKLFRILYNGMPYFPLYNSKHFTIAFLCVCGKIYFPFASFESQGALIVINSILTHRCSIKQLSEIITNVLPGLPAISGNLIL